MKTLIVKSQRYPYDVNYKVNCSHIDMWWIDIHEWSEDNGTYSIMISVPHQNGWRVAEYKNIFVAQYEMKRFEKFMNSMFGREFKFREE